MRGLRLVVLACGMSLLALAPALAQQDYGAHAAIAAAETNINISVGFMHQQYHENLSPGDDESGYVPGFGVGASALLPSAFRGIDLYTALSYQFYAGSLNYNGHYFNFETQATTPGTATDNAVFNHIEGRLGLGVPLAGQQLEFIPFISAGYMSWNRNINNKGFIGTDEFYRTGLLGVGAKLDAALTNTLVASVSLQWSGLVGSNITFDDFGFSHSMGNSGDERVSLGLDQRVSGPFHVFANANWEHFNYAGDKFNAENSFTADGHTYEIAEPVSSTTQIGVNLGVAYSF